MPNDNLARALTQLNDPRGFELLAAGDPPDRGRYVHSTECRHPETDPEWRFEDHGWRRGPCRGHQTCRLVQIDDGRPPAPPRPADDDVKLVDFVSVHGTAHTEVKAEVAGSDRWPHWVARCVSCGTTARWWTEAARHYESQGASITGGRPLARSS